MFSLTIEYAMRAMVALAAGDGNPMTTKQIASTMKVPQSYLSKVLQSLVRAGLVNSTRGLKGGFVLARKPGEVNMMEILNAVRGEVEGTAYAVAVHRRIDKIDEGRRNKEARKVYEEAIKKVQASPKDREGNISALKQAKERAKDTIYEKALERLIASLSGRAEKKTDTP